jgi:hypothetical protein
MILVTHAVVGGALGSLIPGAPILAGISGFLSHFVLDAFPHWDYPISSGKGIGENKMQGDIVVDKAFAKDLIKIGIDATIGIVAAIFFFQAGRSLEEILYSGVLWGALGAMLPDGLQFLYYKIKKEPLTSLQQFHISIHAKKSLNGYTFIGPLIQIALCVAVIVILHSALRLL